MNHLFSNRDINTNVSNGIKNEGCNFSANMKGSDMFWSHCDPTQMKQIGIDHMSYYQLQKVILEKLKSYCNGALGIIKLRRHHIKRAQLVIKAIDELSLTNSTGTRKKQLLHKIIMTEYSLLINQSLEQIDNLSLRTGELENSYFKYDHPRAIDNNKKPIKLSSYMYYTNIENSKYNKVLNESIALIAISGAMEPIVNIQLASMRKSTLLKP